MIKNGIIGCRLVNENNEFLHAGTNLYRETFWGQQIGSGEEDINQYNSDNVVDGVVFACAYIKREVLNKVGFLNEKFFSYFEDTDYCYTARQMGYDVVCCGEVTLIHYQNVSTSINNMNFSKMFLKSQKIFKELWDDTLANKYMTKLAWHSIMNFPTGYGTATRNYIQALDKQKIDVRYKYVYGQGTPFPIEENPQTDSYLLNVVSSRPFTDACPQVVFGQADVFYKNKGKHKIGFSMLETTGIPKEWVLNCNMMDEVWVPSRFNVETFINSGVNKPIHIIPLGFDPNYFNPKIKSLKTNDKFVFLSVFEWGERKCPEMLVDSYLKTFRKSDDVVLICKITNRNGAINIEEEVKKFNINSESPEIVFIYNNDFPTYQMGVLYRFADCFLLPSRGEGWGMPVLEAMACGLPVIATDWSAITEFFNDQVGYPIRVKKLTNAEALCPYYTGFQWAEPDQEHFMHLMRYVYENREDAKTVGEYAAKYALDNWTWEKAAEKIINRI